MVRNPPASNFPSENHIELDSNRFSLISGSFWVCASKKSQCFEFERKFETSKKGVYDALIVLLVFSNSKRLLFYVWIHSKTTQNQGVSIKISNSMWFGDEMFFAGGFLTIFQWVATFCTLPRHTSNWAHYFGQNTLDWSIVKAFPCDSEQNTNLANTGFPGAQGEVSRGEGGHRFGVFATDGHCTAQFAVQQRPKLLPVKQQTVDLNRRGKPFRQSRSLMQKTRTIK